MKKKEKEKKKDNQYKRKKAMAIAIGLTHETATHTHIWYSIQWCAQAKSMMSTLQTSTTPLINIKETMVWCLGSYIIFEHMDIKLSNHNYCVTHFNITHGGLKTGLHGFLTCTVTSGIDAEYFLVPP